ncbi:glycine cleavage system aminomethyltransferase GcvT [Helicovermis profundi]|uniref:Aminomethyltransferase n=1 Tax=Helicovermis profundi TaxID=3065157 RepID=A0AAU9EJH2_9FIRM|nr:hypothetical protein HLPR_04250 [Clostridia bacterium S502]
MSNLQRTALYEEHVKNGGKIVDFAGWELPIQYEGLVVEHEAVRNDCGMFDVSHMGEVTVDGKDAEAFVQYLVTNNVKTMKEKQVIYGQMCYENGGIVDDLLVYKYNTEKYLLVINASNVAKDFAWMQEVVKKFEVKLVNISTETSEVALQGPKAEKLLQNLTDKDLSEIGFFFFENPVVIAGVECIVSRTGYTGEDGFEIYAPNDKITIVWNAIIEKGGDYGLKLCGLGCRDTLRFEVALPLYGNEMSKDISPLEAGLGFFVKLDTDDFIGKSALVKQKEEGLKRKTIGFEIEGRPVARHEYKVLKNGKEIGFVTTGYNSPSVGKSVGIAIVDAEYAVKGEEIEIQIRKKTVKAIVTAKRAYKKSYKK